MNFNIFRKTWLVVALSAIMYVWTYVNFYLDSAKPMSLGESMIAPVFVCPVPYIILLAVVIMTVPARRRGLSTLWSFTLLPVFYLSYVVLGLISVIHTLSIVQGDGMGASAMIYMFTMGAPVIYGIPVMCVGYLIGKARASKAAHDKYAANKSI